MRSARFFVEKTTWTNILTNDCGICCSSPSATELCSVFIVGFHPTLYCRSPSETNPYPPPAHTRPSLPQPRPCDTFCSYSSFCPKNGFYYLTAGDAKMG